MKQPLSRRTVLRGAGGIAVSLPLLHAMEARGQAAEGPRRFGTFLVMASPVSSKWWPTGTETNFTLQPTTASLQPVKNKLLFLKGVNYKVADFELGYSDDHHKVLAGMLTGAKQLRGQFYLNAGWAGGISIDQHLANKIGKDPYRSLVVAPGLTRRDDCTRTSYRAASDPVDPYNNPAQLWDVLFKDLNTTDTTYQQTLEATRLRRASILDGVRAEYSALNARVGTEDQQKLEAHLESVRTLEKRLTTAVPPTSGTSCTKPARPTSFSSYPDSSYPTLVKLHLDLIVQALVCDLTRVFSFQTSYGVSQMMFPWLNIGLKQHDEINHVSSNFNLLDTTSRWYTEQFAYLCTELDKHVEGNRTVLDNCLLWQTYEHENALTHNHNNIPMILAGSAGGRLRTGRVVQYSGQSHNNLFVSILNAMGVPDTTFGEPSICTGPLPNLT